MPSQSHKHLASSIPNSSIPSTGVSATPNTTIIIELTLIGGKIRCSPLLRARQRSNIPTTINDDSQETTPKGNSELEEEEVVIDDAHHNELHTPSGYAEWLNTACQAKKKSIGLEIKMHDPAKAKKQAVKEDLLAKQEARAAAMKEAASKKQKVSLGVPEGRGGDGDEEGRIQSMFCTIGSTQYIFIQEILKGILLTLAAVQVWAADLMARKDGKIQASEASPLLEMVTQFFGELQSNSGTAVERNKGLEMATHPPNDPTSPAYHNFLGIPNREHVLEVLESNGFTSHGSFRSSGLAQSKVSALGLNLSTVTALFDHTTAIDNHLLA
ncbi:hypothetical protein KEM48_011315 [Puccinia striiformis f. sp. tritici PST-130]|nr:hypothetical protein KEM48_011315 [Puccinia striiformis f. sp. tritici PST-130]